MHDLESITLADVIERQKGEATQVAARFRHLSPAEQ
jgi:hypothetical protein